MAKFYGIGTGPGDSSLVTVKAVNTFNLDKNIKLATYASRCIENEILMCLRKNNKKERLYKMFFFVIFFENGLT